LALNRAISTMQVTEEFTAAGFERQRCAFIPAQGIDLGLRHCFIKP
jgi:hypothetical protein